jgi:hypothetical protein
MPTAQEPVYLMRHKDSGHNLRKYIGTELLTLYQARQDLRHAVGGFIVAFYGHRNDHGLLLGVWRISEAMPAAVADDEGLLNGSFESESERREGFYHRLEATDILADLRLKLEVRWGGRPNSWRRVLQAGNDYPATLILEAPVPFRGLDGASLVMGELRLALDDLAWQEALASIAGVYLITDERDGRHYVGSASGAEGILQRWTHYVKTGHGDNLQLVQLLQAFPGRENEFRFTLLESMSPETPRDQVIAREGFWKVALGSRTFGLNSN